MTSLRGEDEGGLGCSRAARLNGVVGIPACQRSVVPLAGIEPALLSEPDFESGASTNSAKGATPKRVGWYAADYTNRGSLVNLFLLKTAFDETLLVCRWSGGSEDCSSGGTGLERWCFPS